MKAKQEVTSTLTIWLREDGILHGVGREGAVSTLETAKADFEATRRVAGGVLRPVLVDIRKVKAVERPAREFLSSAYVGTIVSATALLIKSGISRAIGNFYIGIKAPNYPMKLFTSEADALAWLKQFVRPAGGEDA